MKKTFDAVRMQHEAAEKVQAKLAGMSLDEQVAYWEQRGKDLHKRKARSAARRRAS